MAYNKFWHIRIATSLRKTARSFIFIFIVLVVGMSGRVPARTDPAAIAPGNPLEWPPLTKDNRPWTRWWWLGSAVDEKNLALELTRYEQAGLGGVEITPVYGVKGWEAQFIEYLSPRWMEVLRASVKTSHQLGMGVDMANGTGWCFGGPNVPSEDSNAKVICRTVEVKGGEKLASKYSQESIQALVAFPIAGGQPLDITDRIKPDGTVDWTAPETSAPWTVYSVSQNPSGTMVKRAAPGGAGPMLNLLYGDAMNRYLQRFSKAFGDPAMNGDGPAGMFHDSYEYQSDWAPDFFAQFEKRRGYKLQNELPSLFGQETDDHVARVKSDYRETISDILSDESIPAWTSWAHEHGSSRASKRMDHRATGWIFTRRRTFRKRKCSTRIETFWSPNLRRLPLT